MAYERKFITLTQEKGDFTLKNAVSMGTCILEENLPDGKLTINVQNLIPEVTYKVYLAAVFPDHTLCVKIGTVLIDSKGKGSGRLKFNAVSVDDTPYGIKKFCVVLLAAEKGNAMTFVLSGNIGEPVNWKNDYVFADKERDWQKRFKSAAVNQNGGEAENGGKAKEFVNNEDQSSSENEVEKAAVGGVITAGAACAAFDSTSLDGDGNEAMPGRVGSDEGEREDTGEDFDGGGDIQSTGCAGIECASDGGNSAMQENEAEINGAGAEEINQAGSQAEAHEAAGDDDSNSFKEDVVPSPEAEFHEGAEESYDSDADMFNQEYKPQHDEVFYSNSDLAQEAEQACDGDDSLDKEDAQTTSLQEAHKKFLQTAQRFNMEMETLEDDKHTCFEAMSSYDSELIDELFMNNTAMIPFSRQKKDVSWIKISADDLESLSFLITGETRECNMVKLGLSRYEHLIFGRFLQGVQERYILGVPDQYRAAMKSSSADFGFYQFKHCIGEMPGENSHGYWLKIL